MPRDQRPADALPVPDALPVLDAGAHRDHRSGSCVMEYVSVLAGERFSDRPACTHPAVAALAWQVNDALADRHRPPLARRAPALIGAGRSTSTPVRPRVLAAVARAGLALDPDHRFFRRLARRAAREGAAPGPDGTGGRVARLLHVGPVNQAYAHLQVAARAAGLDRDARDALALAVLDDCLADLLQLADPDDTAHVADPGDAGAASPPSRGPDRRRLSPR